MTRHEKLNDYAYDTCWLFLLLHTASALVFANDEKWARLALRLVLRRRMAVYSIIEESMEGIDVLMR
jgi:hypothetical protein